MAKGGCNKCTGSCACKSKKPRAKKAPAKRVIGGRAKAPQVVIMPPAVPTAALPTGVNPYQTVVTTSTPGINKTTRGMQTMATETERPMISTKGRLDVSTVTPEMRKQNLNYFMVGGPPSLLKGALEKAKVTMTPIQTGQTKPGIFLTTTERRINPSRLLTEPPKPKLVTSVVGTQPKIPSLREYLSMPSSSLVQGVLKYSMRPAQRATTETQTETEKRKKPYDAGFMSILPQAIRLENVRQRAIGEKPSMTTMEAQTEPLEVKVSKGQKQSIFEFMKQQELTGKTAALTGAGRPFRENVEAAFVAAGPPPSPPAAESP